MKMMKQARTQIRHCVQMLELEIQTTTVTFNEQVDLCQIDGQATNIHRKRATKWTRNHRRISGFFSVSFS